MHPRSQEALSQPRYNPISRLIFRLALLPAGLSVLEKPGEDTAPGEAG